MYQYNTEQWLPVNIDAAWKFFSTPVNLAKITPPELDFKILTADNSRDIYEGMKIDYKVKPVLGIPVRWQTEIKTIEKNKQFTDVQNKGPYKTWEHTHYFSEQDGGVMMRDEIKYQLPLSWLGRFAHWLFVKNKIRRIFKYRENILNKIFSAS